MSTIAELTTALGLYPPAMGTATVDANGNLTFTASGSNAITVDPPATATKFGVNVFNALAANGTVIGQDISAFLDQSIGGGAVTCYDVSGSPVNIQLRWAKTDSALYGGTDTWNLFYQVNPNATGQQTAWQNAGVNYMFGANGQMDPLIGTLALTGVTVNGIALGDVQLVHGAGGVTQFADPNGSAQVNLLQQNGFPAGELQQVAVSDNGRVVGTYSTAARSTSPRSRSPTSTAPTTSSASTAAPSRSPTSRARPSTARRERSSAPRSRAPIPISPTSSPS